MNLSKQTTSTLLMIRPVKFGFNEQTAGSNAFQDNNASTSDAQTKALAEFDNFVNVLKSKGVSVIVIEDTPEPHTPDSIFPNNWVSFHENGDILLYPMQAENRRLERREDIIRKLEEKYAVKHITDLSRFEHQDKFLEGTGSMVLDRENRVAYACLSPRTNIDILKVFAEQEKYKALTFNAFDEHKKAIYHTNVLMCIGSKFVVICMDSVTNVKEKAALSKSFEDTNKEVIEISFNQMNHFAGNMLEVQNNTGENLLVMSQQAYESLDKTQIDTLSKYARLIYADLNTIETLGGGSARCMLAEVHLPLIK